MCMLLYYINSGISYYTALPLFRFIQGFLIPTAACLFASSGFGLSTTLTYRVCQRALQHDHDIKSFMNSPDFYNYCDRKGYELAMKEVNE